jgi:hypothetical protein
MNLSYQFDVSSGATVVLVSASLFALVFVATGSRRLRGPGRTGSEAPASAPLSG